MTQNRNKKEPWLTKAFVLNRAIFTLLSAIKIVSSWGTGINIVLFNIQLYQIMQYFRSPWEMASRRSEYIYNYREHFTLMYYSNITTHLVFSSASTMVVVVSSRILSTILNCSLWYVAWLCYHLPLFMGQRLRRFLEFNFCTLFIGAKDEQLFSIAKLQNPREWKGSVAWRASLFPAGSEGRNRVC